MRYAAASGFRDLNLKSILAIRNLQFAFCNSSETKPPQGRLLPRVIEFHSGLFELDMKGVLPPFHIEHQAVVFHRGSSIILFRVIFERKCTGSRREYQLHDILA